MKDYTHTIQQLQDLYKDLESKHQEASKVMGDALTDSEWEDAYNEYRKLFDAFNATKTLLKHLED